MDNVSKEIKEYGTINTFLPEAGALERATTYRDKKIKPLFIQMKNKIAAMAAQVKELTRERDALKISFRRKSRSVRRRKKNCRQSNRIKRNCLRRKIYFKIWQVDTTGSCVYWGMIWWRILSKEIFRTRKSWKNNDGWSQMPQGSIKERMAWAEEKRRMEIQQRKKNRTKNRGMEL